MSLLLASDYTRLLVSQLWLLHTPVPRIVTFIVADL